MNPPMSAQKTVLKNTAYLTLSHIITKILGLIVVVFIARSLGPYLFGQFKAILAFIGIFSLFTDFGMDKIIIRDSSKNIYVLNESISKFLPIRIVLSIGLFIAMFGIALFLPQNKFPIFLVAIAGLSLISDSIFNGISIIFHAAQKMEYIAFCQIIQKVVYIISAVLLFYFAKGVLSIMLAITLASVLTLPPAFKFAKGIVDFKIKPVFDFSFFKRTIRPAIWFAFSIFFALVFTKIDILMISALSSLEEVGYYAIAMTIAFLFLYGVGSLHASLFPLSSKNLTTQYFFALLSKILKIVFMGAILALSFNLFLSKLTLRLFGPQYQPSLNVLNVLVWLIPVFTAAVWISQVFDSTNNQKLHVLTGAFVTITNVCLNFALIPRYGGVGASIASLMAWSTSIIIGGPLALKIVRTLG